MQLLAADDFTYNSHALKSLRDELAISMKTSILQIGGGWLTINPQKGNAVWRSDATGCAMPRS